MSTAPPETRRLAAIMFTDMVGYSALTGRDEGLALRLLAHHNELLRPLIARHQGREVKTIGDAFFVEFGSAVGAVHCALEMQRTLAQNNASVPEAHRIQIRIGIHVGDVVQRDNDLFGDGVNIAARLEPQATAGGICVSEDVFRQADRRAEAAFFRIGRVKLKNIAHPMVIYRVTEPGARGPSVVERLRHRFGVRRLGAGTLVALVAVLLACAWLMGRTSMVANAPPVVAPAPKVIDVIVADALNDTGERDLDGLSGLVITALERSRLLHPLTRASMLDLLRGLGHDPHEVLDEKQARLIAAARKVGVLVRITVKVFDSVYSVRLDAIDAAHGAVLLSATEKVLSNRGFPAAVARLTSRMRAGLGESTDENREEDLASLTTTDMEAYQHYFVADALTNRMQMLEAEREFEQATTIDPRFALAWVRLAYVRAWQFKDPSKALEKALEMQERLPLKERYFLKLQRTIAEGDVDHAIAFGRELVERYPNEKEGWYCLGDLLHHRARFAEGLVAFERAVEIDPWFERANDHVVQAKLGLGDYAGAVEAATRFVERVPGPESSEVMVEALLRSGDFEGAYRIAKVLSEQGSINSEQAMGPGTVRLYEGQAVLARQEFERLATSKSKRSQRDAHKGLAWVLVFEGRYRAAFKELDTVMALDRELSDRGDLSRQMSYRAFLTAVGFHDADEVERWLTKALDLKSDDWVAHFYALRAWLAVGKIERAAGVQDFQATVDSFRKLALETARLTQEHQPEAAQAMLETAYRFTDAPGGVADLLIDSYAEHHQPLQVLDMMARIERLKGQRTPDFPSLWVYVYPHAQRQAMHADRELNGADHAKPGLDALKARWQAAEPEVRDVAAVRGE